MCFVFLCSVLCWLKLHYSYYELMNNYHIYFFSLFVKCTACSLLRRSQFPKHTARTGFKAINCRLAFFFFIGMKKKITPFVRLIFLLVSFSFLCSLSLNHLPAIFLDLQYQPTIRICYFQLCSRLVSILFSSLALFLFILCNMANFNLN